MMGLCSAAWLVLWLVTPAKADADESCIVTESCVLPCSFQGGNDVVVHWNLMKPRDHLVHSYYQNQDQLAHQDQRFRGRTSLFKDQISRGNASLQLTEVQVQDQGRYKCHTSTIRGNMESFINLRVDAPVGKVDLQQVGNRTICSSEGIFPQPELTWSTSPPSNVTFKSQTEVQETEQLLYNISSSLVVSDTDLSYNCTVSTRRNRRRATLQQLPSLSRSGTETTIPCTASHTSITSFSLVWRFNRSEIVLTQTGADVTYTVSEGWRQQVKGVSESGGLMLGNLSSQQEGMYTCELSDAEETLITNTFLWIESPGGQSDVTAVAIAVVLVVMVVLLVVLVLYYKCQMRTAGRNTAFCPSFIPLRLIPTQVI
uniref:V-set domain-containing T-cell activation inhibitor 1-like n=1 Tax=Seriola dumerili TaxID=41447 RepID=A0A3B4TVP7_SERDU